MSVLIERIFFGTCVSESSAPRQFWHFTTKKLRLTSPTSNGCNLVDGLNYAVDIALRDDHKPIPFLSKKKVEVTVPCGAFDRSMQHHLI